MRFIFVNPKVADEGEFYSFPLGLAYVAAAMKRASFDTVCINLCHDKRSVLEQLADVLPFSGADVVCTGGMSINFHEINAVIASAKALQPGVTTVVGGPLATADPELAAELIGFDIGVMGEGEIAMTELAARLVGGADVSDVAGLIVSMNARGAPTPAGGQTPAYVRTAPRRENLMLDELPPPDYEGFGFDRFLATITPESVTPDYTAVDDPRVANIITARSCPFNCTFCYHPLGNRYRQRSLDPVFAEIEHLVKTYRINMLYVMDELFSMDRDRVLEFCARIKPYNLKWLVSLRVTHVDAELLEAMRNAGTYAIGYGIESMSPRVLKSMRKQITTGEVERALALTRSLNVGVVGNLIFGDPEEDQSTVKESMDWLRTNRKYGIQLMMIRVLPDAQIYRDAVKRGLIRDKAQYMRDGFPIVNVSKLSLRELSRLCNLVYWYVYGCDSDLLPFGDVVGSRVCGSGYGGRRTFAVALRCQNCRRETEYKNLTQRTIWSIRGYGLFFCRHCWQRVAVRSRDAFRANYRLRDNTFSNWIILNTIDFVCNCKPLFAMLHSIRMRWISDRGISRLFSFIGRH